jgi:hypothetical protein
MIQPINWAITIPILYLAVLVFTAVYIAVKYNDLHALLVVVAACVWPLYYITEFLIFILENHADRKAYIKTKKTNFFDDTAEGRKFVKDQNYTKRDIERIRKGKVARPKKGHVKVP